MMKHDKDGEECLVLCTIKDLQGEPIPGVKIDIWETDSSGHYDLQDPHREKPDGRGVMHSDSDGNFWFKAIKPVSYPIPTDGPVGELLRALKRHPYRPAHMHFMLEKEGYDKLVTALYLRGDPYEASDAVFGVKESLLVEFSSADGMVARKYGVERGSPVLEYDCVLVTEREAGELRDERSRKAMEELGLRMKIVEGLPVPDVD